jgi:hypothetical protein
MLSIWGEKQAFCDGISRRSFLRIGALGAGLTLADLLRGRAAAAGAGRPTANKSAIMVYLPGGPSHLDMYDLKPDAPREFRGEFNPIATNVPGIQICEHLPRQARMFDKLAVIRSVISVGEHSDSMVTTGYSARDNLAANHPSFGAVVSKLRGDGGNVPPFVSLRGLSRGTEPGFLGMAHRPFNPSGPGVQDLRLANGTSMDRVAERRSLLSSFDGMRRELDTGGTLAGLDSFTGRAFDMIASGGVRTALDLSREPASSRERYRGIEQFLTARRLVEAGVGCVTLGYGSWDTHGNNFQSLRRQLPILDRAIANLVQDLDDRGLQNDVAVIVWGEFGRTPRINRNAGRDHWPQVMSALVAGGGMRMGQAIGASSPRGERPQDRPYTASQVLSTLYRVLGIDPAMTFPSNTGRPVYVLDDRMPVRELI